MAVEYDYRILKPLQDPGHMAQLNKDCADGWRVHTALPAYSELYVLLEREVPEKEAKAAARKAETKDEHKSEAKPAGKSSGKKPDAD